VPITLQTQGNELRSVVLIAALGGYIAGERNALDRSLNVNSNVDLPRPFFQSPANRLR
jgi:hypothetical protein